MENSRPGAPAGSTSTDHPRWSEVRVAATFGIMAIYWAIAANLLGREVGFTSCVLIGLAYSIVHWRERLTPRVLAKIALYGVPVCVLALYWS